MTSIRARKAGRELRQQWGRAAGVVVAMALAVLAVTAISTSFYLAKTQQRSGYLATNPPSATLVTTGLTPQALARVRALPQVAAADTSRTVSARIRRPGDAEWRTMRLTARGDYAANTIARLVPRTGAWPPPAGHIVLEDSGLPLLSDIAVGDRVEVELPGQPASTLTVAGTNSDHGSPPGWVEGMLYGYVTPDTLARLGLPAGPEQLRLLVAGDRLDRAHIQQVAAAARAELTAAGVRVGTVDVPAPGRHPHQDIMDGMLQLELLFGVLALALAVLLTTTVTAGLLAGQTRQIGTLKALGARTGQVAGGYLTSAALLAVLACLAGWPLGRLAGLAFVDFVAEFMNFEVNDTALPWWLVTGQLAAGLAVPLLTAGLLVWRTARVTAAKAISGYGVTAPRPRTAAARLADRLPSAAARLPRLPVLGARNAIRRRGRLLLASAALALAGTTFMAAGNVSDGLADSFVEQTLAAEPYDLTAVLDRPYPAPEIEAAVAGVAGVHRAEKWLSATATSATGDTVAITGVPADTPGLKLRVVSGRWLATGAARQIVLSKQFADEHGAAPGGDILLRVGDRAATWRVVGIAVQIGGPGAWVGYGDLADSTGTAGATNLVRLVTTDDTTDVAAVRRDLEGALADAGATVVTVRTQDDLRQTLVAHQIIFVVFLNLMTLVSVVVGGLGLATILAVAVTERTRELGVLRAVGATNRSLRRLVVAEAITIGVVSWALAAVLLAVPATWAFGTLFGTLLLGTPLAFTINVWTVAAWLALVVAICVLASLLPARRAARMTVSRALAYE